MPSSIVLKALLSSLLLCAIALPLALTLHDVKDLNAAPANSLVRRTVNSTEFNACKELTSNTYSAVASKIFFPLSLEYGDGTHHYMSSSQQNAACVFRPTTPADLSTVLRYLGEKRIRFGVSSGGHSSNRGFSSTRGVHITLHGFRGVEVSGDKSYIDVGGGNVWNDVYDKLDGKGVNVVGGRVPGVGVGGFITGGGGYSWKTNQHGLTSDTLLRADLVLPSGELVRASETENPDLFWAIKGGGNQFGIIYNYRLRAVPQPAKIYGGVRLYTQDQVPALIKATYNFSENNKDPKAQVITTLNNLGLLGGGAMLLAIYDGQLDRNNNPFAAFDKVKAVPLLADLKEQSFSSAIGSIPSQIQGSHRGLFHSVMFQRYSKPLLDQIGNLTTHYGKQMLTHSGALVSFDIEPFLSFKDKTKDAAWPHSNDALPLNIYFAWDNPADDAFWHKAAKEAFQILTDQARAEGQKIDDLWLYPNYLISDTPVQNIFGPNLACLRSVKQKYDPQNVMRLAGYFNF